MGVVTAFKGAQPMRARDLFIIVMVALFGSTLYAQETTGKLQGRVADAQGLAVPGVTVTAAGPQGNKTATTDADGRFTIPFLTPGVYIVRAQLQGFKAFERSGVTVGLGQTVDVPVKMEVGAVAETVNITAAPQIIDTTSTTAGAVISSDLLENVPVGRRLADTLYLAPGA